jgi:ketosteroid isomerase-like protein
MSAENVDLVQDWFKRWNEGDRSIADDEIHPGVEIVSRFQKQPYRGRDGFRQWMTEIDEQFESWRLVVDDWRDAGDLVVGTGHIRIRGQASGVEFDQPMGWAIELDQGRLLRMRVFVDPGDALEAAGLE